MLSDRRHRLMHWVKVMFLLSWGCWSGCLCEEETPAWAYSSTSEATKRAYRDVPQVNVPFNFQGTASSRNWVEDSFQIGKVEVIINVLHPNVENLRVSLRSPYGTQVVLIHAGWRTLSPRGRNYEGTHFSDAAAHSLHDLRSPALETFLQLNQIKDEATDLVDLMGDFVDYNATPPPPPSPPPTPVDLFGFNGFTQTVRPESTFRVFEGEHSHGEWVLEVNTMLDTFVPEDPRIVNWTVILSPMHCTATSDPLTFMAVPPAPPRPSPMQGEHRVELGRTWGTGPGAGTRQGDPGAGGRACSSGCPSLGFQATNKEFLPRMPPAPLLCLHGTPSSTQPRILPAALNTVVPSVNSSLDFSVAKVEVFVSLTHVNIHNIEVQLVSPRGRNVTLVPFRHMQLGDIRDVVFTDDGEPYRDYKDRFWASVREQEGDRGFGLEREETVYGAMRARLQPAVPLETLRGESAAGEWSLLVTDLKQYKLNLQTGFLDAWQLWLWPEPCERAPPDQAVSPGHAPPSNYTGAPKTGLAPASQSRGLMFVEALAGGGYALGCGASCPQGSASDAEGRVCVLTEPSNRTHLDFFHTMSHRFFQAQTGWDRSVDQGTQVRMSQAWSLQKIVAVGLFIAAACFAVGGALQIVAPGVHRLLVAHRSLKGTQKHTLPYKQVDDESCALELTRAV